MRNIILKRALFLGIICLALLFINSCTSITTTPYFYTSNANANFEMLGEIIYESTDRFGYIELLRAARRLYPDCDYVIDIMIDRRDTTTTFFGLKNSDTTWIMRGTAIKYKK